MRKTGSDADVRMNLRGLMLVCLLLAGCSNRPALVLPYFAPYKMDIQQGNVVTQEMIDKIQPGMSRSQVRFALGTPLVQDVFHADRWDYVYQFQKGGTVTDQRRIVVHFKDDKLVRVEGDVVPMDPAKQERAIREPVAPAPERPRKPAP